VDKNLLSILVWVFFLGGLFGMAMGFVKFVVHRLSMGSWESEEGSGSSPRRSRSSFADAPSEPRPAA
jgi:hypothetical protein